MRGVRKRLVLLGLGILLSAWLNFSFFTLTSEPPTTTILFQVSERCKRITKLSGCVLSVQTTSHQRMWPLQRPNHQSNFAERNRLIPPASSDCRPLPPLTGCRRPHVDHPQQTNHHHR